MERQIALDTETTGKAEDGTPGDHRIIEIGCVEIVDRKLTGKELQLYINPERSVDDDAFKVHGISDEFLADKPLFRDVAQEFIDFIDGAELLIHNAKFDTGFMDKEFKLLNLGKRTQDMCRVTDTIALAKKINPNNAASLDNLCNLYSIDRSARTKHGALLDAQLLAEVYLAMTGGQISFEFDSKSSAPGAKWQRPANQSLPRMTVEKQRHAVHLRTMLSLLEPVMTKGDDGKYEAKSLWYDDISLGFSAQDDGKESVKKMFMEQTEEILRQKLSRDEQKLLQDYLEQDKKDQSQWLERVQGKH